MEPLSDEELVARYRTVAGTAQGERWLNELFQRHHSRVALWCLRMTGDRESATDLAQEVFLKAFRYLDSYRGDSKFSTWLYSIARNHCFSELRSRATAPEEVGEPLTFEFTDTAPRPDHQAERQSDAQLVRELIHSTLDETESKVFTLHFAEELPLDAITRLLKLENTSGAKAYIVSAKRKLARAVERLKVRRAPS